MSESRQTVAGAYDKIEAHEDLCAERYINIHARIDDVKKSLDQGRNGIWVLAVGLISWLALQVYGGLKPPAPPSTQTMVMQQPAAAPAAPAAPTVPAPR